MGPVPPDPQTQDWLRWGFIAVPMFVAMPRADTLSWILIGITLALSIPLLWLYADGRPTLPAALMVSVVAASGALWATVPNSFASVTMFSTTFFVVLRQPVVPIVVAVLLDFAAITIFAGVATPGRALPTYTIVAVMILLGLNRRTRLANIEQTELALARAQTATEEHARAAALAERARIARDVHDVLAHSLSALAVQLQGARLMLVRDGAAPDTIAQVERAQRLATEGLAEARRAVAALRSEPVDVASGLRALVADAPGATLEIDGEPSDLSATARETLLRTAQEALSNARKHAAGAPVTVRLAHRDGTTELEVHDRVDTPPERTTGGYGLVGMAERAALAGATLDAGPVEDGWRVRLLLPDHPA